MDKVEPQSKSGCLKSVAVFLAGGVAAAIIGFDVNKGLADAAIEQSRKVYLLKFGDQLQEIGRRNLELAEKILEPDASSKYKEELKLLRYNLRQDLEETRLFQKNAEIGEDRQKRLDEQCLEIEHLIREIELRTSEP